ncbi:hypothetical protein ACLK17_19845 [Escherichia coli]
MLVRGMKASGITENTLMMLYNGSVSLPSSAAFSTAAFTPCTIDVA